MGSAVAKRMVDQGIGVHLSGRDETKLRVLGDTLLCPISRADVLDDGEVEHVIAEAGETIQGRSTRLGLSR